MSAVAPSITELGRGQPDLIDRIAAALPAEIRADYYRELRHCRSLPENDEMLRILRVMQFLTLLIEQAPARLAAERERIDETLKGVRDSLAQALSESVVYHEDLDRRLTELPHEITSAISPEAIADTIRENLRQQLVRSALPETAEALAVTSGEMKKVCAEFTAAAKSLTRAYNGTADEARGAIRSMEREIAAAAQGATLASRELRTYLGREAIWCFLTVTVAALLFGFALGMVVEAHSAFFMPDPAPKEIAPSAVQPVQPQQHPLRKTSK